MSVTDDQGGSKEAQVIDPPATQPEAKVSSPPITQADIDKAVHKAISEQGRKHADEKRAWRKAQEDIELMSFKEDPDGERAVRAKHEAARSKEEADAKIAEADERLSQAKAIESRVKAEGLGAKHNLDSNLLISLSDGNIEKMEQLVKVLNPVTVTPSEVPPAVTPDYGGTGGSGTWESLQEAYIKDPDNPKIKAEYLQKRKEQGR